MGKAGVAGLHERVKGQSCQLCHHEHLGREARITTAFDHGLLEPGGKCQECHRRDAPASGFHSSLTQDCAACHSTSTWKTTTFDHGLSRFPLTGGHRGEARGYTYDSQACYRCHPTGSEHEGGGEEGERGEEGEEDDD